MNLPESRGYGGRKVLTWLFVLSLVFGSLPADVVQALDTPELLSPPDGTVATVDNHPPLGLPELSWTPIAGATTYRVQLSQDVGFANKVEFTTAATRFTPVDVTPFNDGTWYWRVRADAPPPAGAYSTARTFTKAWAGASTQPVLTAPTDGALLDFYDAPVFSWQPVVGAAAYRVQIAASANGFATPEVDQTTLAASFQPPAKLADGLHYWRVSPLDPANRTGIPSAVRSFTADYAESPLLLEPAQKDVAHPENDPVYTPTFSWTAVRGAELYHLQYTTDPTFAANLTTIETRNTSYTPKLALPNDTNYYWRLQVKSGSSLGDWSEIRTVFKRWYTQPQLLTPVNNHQAVNGPLFSWTPVPGASYYKVEVNHVNSFPPHVIYGWTATTANTAYFRPAHNYWMASGVIPSNRWYWRVTPYDRNHNAGVTSLVYSFDYTTTLTTPQLIAPPYYYTPSAEIQPHEDRSVAWPLFQWQPAFAISTTTPEVAGYRIQVDDTPLFLSPWTVDTENQNAAPTVDNPLPLSGPGHYYWRVRALNGSSQEIGLWSQVWWTRIDPSLSLTAAAGTTPTLLRPAHAAEVVENVPAFEWWSLQGADSYEIEISLDPAFAASAVEGEVAQPVFAPTQRLPFGTYYWRVRGMSGGTPLGAWSAAWRFQIAGNSQWDRLRTIGNLSAPLSRPLATDPAGDMTDGNYDLTSLYAWQSSSNWFFGFHTGAAITNVALGLYLDLDHVDGSGAPNDAGGFNVTPLTAHRPEYAVYLFRSGGGFNAGQVLIYRWTGSAWASPQTLDAVGGAVYVDGSYVEIGVPNTAIGMQEATGSAALTLFSAFASGGHAQDTVPSDPNVAFTTPDAGGSATALSRYTSVSEKLNLVWPPNNATGDPSLWASLPPFVWQWPVGAPWHGYEFQLARDPEFTTLVTHFPVARVSTLFGPLRVPTGATDLTDGLGDNTYYWRVRPVYYYDGTIEYRGAWSQAFRLERAGFVPQNLQVSVSFATPTFSWDMVEGAKGYELQVDNDPGFGSPEIPTTAIQPEITARNRYTPLGTLANGTYYWRVRVRRSNGTTVPSDSGDVANDWTQPQSFVLDLPQPTGLHHLPGGPVNRAPTLCWDPLVIEALGQPVLAAWKYDLQVSRDPNFSTIYDSTNPDPEQSCWTPAKGYADGTYYWRVAMIDGHGKLASYSPAAQFTKQYPIPTLISPANGAGSPSAPTFAWGPVAGAAEYRLEVSEFNTFSPLYDSVTTDNTRFTPTKAYTPQKAYYWRVAMVDKNGNLGPFQGAVVLVGAYDHHVYVPLAVR